MIYLSILLPILDSSLWYIYRKTQTQVRSVLQLCSFITLCIIGLLPINLRVNYIDIHKITCWNFDWDCSEKAMAPHSSTLAWKIPWVEEPGRLQSMGSLRVEHDWATSLSLFTFMRWRRKRQPTPVCSCLENPRDGGVWWAAVYGVAQSRTRLRRLSSSSSIVNVCGKQILK